MIEFKQQLWGERVAMYSGTLKGPTIVNGTGVWQCKFIIYLRARLLLWNMHTRVHANREREESSCVHTVAGGRAMIYVRRAICANNSSSPSCARAQLNSDNRPRKSLPARTDCTPFRQPALLFICVAISKKRVAHAHQNAQWFIPSDCDYCFTARKWQRESMSADAIERSAGMRVLVQFFIFWAMVCVFLSYFSQCLWNIFLYKFQYIAITCIYQLWNAHHRF